MSLDIIRKNSGSPFKLQRSMVVGANEDNAYTQGGFNPDIVYNNDLANSAIASFGDVVGDALTKIKPKATKEEPLDPNSVRAQAAKAFDPAEKVKQATKKSLKDASKRIDSSWRK
jgi:hypothetical protein